jgi:hypothetical protein
MLEKCISLICMVLLFFSRNQSTRGVKSPKDTLAAARTGKVGLADWKSVRPTWALAGAVSLADWEAGLADSGQAVDVVGLADWEIGLADSELVVGAVGLADWEVGLADLEQAGVGLADNKVGSANSEQADNPPLLLVGA